jgi:hypothetical protein
MLLKVVEEPEDTIVKSKRFFDMYMSKVRFISYDFAHRTYTVPSSWRHTMNKKQKLSSVAHLIIVSW